MRGDLMSDEARKAFVKFAADYEENGMNDTEDSWWDIYHAGVSEGIRQAREAAWQDWAHERTAADDDVYWERPTFDAGFAAGVVEGRRLELEAADVRMGSMAEGPREEYFEWGYRLADGVENWEESHGTDGSWIGHDFEHAIPSIATYDDTTADDIKRALTKADESGAVVLRRKVTTTRGPVEEVDRG